MSSDVSQATDIVIRVRDVDKHYLIFEQPEDRFKQMVLPRLQRLFGREAKQYYSDFAALSGISFNVSRGETVGIIGRNGAGKSTLLQIICGTLGQSSGSVEVNGRVAALLELGAGFNPEFTGRENVFLNAAILGLSHEETEARFDSITAFADIGDFIDYPVKTYSSGMYVRLAFAVQAQVDPDILIVDEALAVGDARFQNKCFNRLQELKQRGTSILLVTHSTEQLVTHCDRAILLDRGRKVDEGLPRAVVNRYLDLLYGRPAGKEGVSFSKSGMSQENAAVAFRLEQLQNADPEFATRSEAIFMERPAYNGHEHRWGDRRGEILDFFLLANNEPFPPVIKSGSYLTLFVRYRFLDEILRPICGFTLKTKDGVTLYGTNTEVGAVSGDVPHGIPGREFIIRFEAQLHCGGGDYFLSIGLASRDVNGDIIPHDRRYDSIHLHVSQEPNFYGLSNFQAKLKIHADA